MSGDDLRFSVFDFRFEESMSRAHVSELATRHHKSKIVHHDSAIARRSPGFTLVEAVISIMIVSVMLVAGLSTVGASRVAQHKAALTIRGRFLAGELLSEILAQSYIEPDETPLFGREASESATTRIDFDDVDDYHGWTCSPPTASDGAALANSTGWTRTVTVEWIDPLDPALVRFSETNAKRITVTAAYNDVPQASLAAIRAAR